MLARIEPLLWYAVAVNLLLYVAVGSILWVALGRRRWLLGPLVIGVVGLWWRMWTH